MTENLYIEMTRQFDESYKYIKERISAAAEKSGRSAGDITLLAATKTVSVEVINHAVSAGITTVGENRVQEYLEKYEALLKESCDCQFIGRLQRNKVKYLIDKVSCIQSVDNIKLAEEISKNALKHQKVMNILIEVNIGEEENKGGILPGELMGFIEKIRFYQGISIQGLMTIPPICDKSVELCRYFSSMAQYYVDIKAKNIDNVYMNCLSMGMSDDYELAIENGATMVRVGSSLFGKRIT